ncbi:MAG: hypothetical protein ACTSPI_17105, partial [Candidatus Heimdallarchaeaceae archaeon]
MADTFLNTTNRRVDSFFSTPSLGATETLRQYGYPLPEKEGISFGKKSLNVLTGVLDVLRTGEYAMGGILSGKGLIAGIKEKISPSEALGIRTDEEKLWSLRGLTGLAVDILLDPVTYLTFGAGGTLKLSTKGGQVLLNKSGQKLIRQMVKRGASEAAARRAMAKILQRGGQKAAEKYIGKAGLKFMGQVFIPASKFQTAAKAIKATPVVGGLAQKVGNGFARAFKPFSDIDALPAKIGGKGTYVDLLYKPFERETRNQIFKQIDDVKKIATKAYKEHGIEVGKTIGYKIEKRKLTGSRFLDDIIKWMSREQDEMLKIEKATGKKVGYLKGYLRHYLTPDGQKFISEGNKFSSVIPKTLRAKLSAAKPRKIEGTIREINTLFRQKYKIKNFFEPDAFKAFAMRKAEHTRFLNTHNFLEAAKARFGTPIEKAVSRYTDEGIKLVESTAPELKGYLLPEPIVKHIDDTMKFLTNEETAKGILSVYDKLLGIWKMNVTGVFPALHTRNAIGGTFNN